MPALRQGSGPGGDNPDVVASIAINHNENTASGSHAQGHKSLLRRRFVVLPNSDRELIVENAARFCKLNAVLSHVREGLVWVPFEGHTPIVHISVCTVKAAAQTGPILKTVEPDYGKDLNQPTLTLPVVIDFEILPDGSPFSIASQDGGLDHRVVQALAQYRFVKSKTGMGMSVTVPLKQTIASYDVGQRVYDPAPAAALELAKKIETATLAKFEKDLPKKDSVAKRAALLVHAATHSGDDVNQVRLRQLDWLIQNEPRAEVLKTSVALIPKAEDRAGYEAIRQLWLARVKQNPVNRDVLEGASNFLRLSDPDDVVTMLQPYAGRMLHAMEWLGELYGLHAIGTTSVDLLSGTVTAAAPSLPNTGYSSASRASLLRHTELPILLTAFATMNEAARTLNTAGRLPEGFEGFCTSLLTRIKALKPNYARSCENRSPGLFQVPPDVMSGKLTKQVRPVYPKFARDGGIQGTVVLACIIGKDGKIAKMGLIKGPLALYEESRRAVSGWEYQPFLIDGQPVEVVTEIEVN